MGQILGVISIVLILSAIYFKIDGDKNIAKNLFISGIVGILLFVLITVGAIFD